MLTNFAISNCTAGIRPTLDIKSDRLLGLSAGEIVIFDRAYVDFEHLFELDKRGVFWVTRTKTNLRFRVVKRRHKKNTNPKILADEEVVVLNKDSRKKYPRRLRRVRALVEVDGEEREMEFLTNNMEWSAQSVADLYRSRWAIETFFNPNPAIELKLLP